MIRGLITGDEWHGVQELSRSGARHSVQTCRKLHGQRAVPHDRGLSSKASPLRHHKVLLSFSACIGLLRELPLDSGLFDVFQARVVCSPGVP